MQKLLLLMLLALLPGSVEARPISPSFSSAFKISTTAAGIVFDLPRRRKLIFDGTQFVVIDSVTLGGILIQNPSFCKSIPREVPAGLIDGINDTFTLARTPKSGSEFVFINGLQQNLGDDYTIVQGTITFVAEAIPNTGYFLNVNYCHATSEPDFNFPTPPFAINGSQIQDSTITPLQLEESLKRPIQSTASGGEKRILSITFDPITGLIKVTYED